MNNTAIILPALDIDPTVIVSNNQPFVGEENIEIAVQWGRFFIFL